MSVTTISLIYNDDILKIYNDIDNIYIKYNKQVNKINSTNFTNIIYCSTHKQILCTIAGTIYFYNLYGDLVKYYHERNEYITYIAISDNSEYYATYGNSNKLNINFVDTDELFQSIIIDFTPKYIIFSYNNDFMICGNENFYDIYKKNKSLNLYQYSYGTQPINTSIINIFCDDYSDALIIILNNNTIETFLLNENNPDKIIITNCINNNFKKFILKTINI